MEHLFPRALLDCISVGREPQPDELALLRDKIWREAFQHDGSPPARHRAATIACAALRGRDDEPAPCSREA